ncbi:60S acidic ribosomal protein P2 [Culex quinquefasciatus]|uniref:Large ribosomal subunit protein P2 n=1 Tax=Culex quinquefasciatus TaxID=7176 RepID=B0WRG9_CULQU|nr:60S acidic ribosomal protein P2 [Culex quinquefasciatus]|eukprot:XP_001851303.1 60S acidic ribosomal protein P2 [Culex quinquefasciatus]
MFPEGISKFLLLEAAKGGPSSISASSVHLNFLLGLFAAVAQIFLIAVPSNPDIEKVLSSVGIETDSTRVTKVVNEMKGKSVVELIATRREKLSWMPSGGAALTNAAKEKNKAKEGKEFESEDDDDMGFGLFE